MKNLIALLLLVALIGLAAYFFWPAKPVNSQRLTPEGTVSLLCYASVTTADGVIGFPPGTVLKIVAKRSKTLVLSDGKVTVEVPRSDTTDDLDVAARAARDDARAQAELAKWQDAAANAAARAEREAAVRREADRLRRSNADASTTPTRR